MALKNACDGNRILCARGFYVTSEGCICFNMQQEPFQLQIPTLDVGLEQYCLTMFPALAMSSS